MGFLKYFGKSTSKRSPEGTRVGEVIHYFKKPSAGIIKLTGTLEIGDRVLIKRLAGDFIQKVVSMQINGERADKAKKGQEVGLKVKKRVREGEVVLKLSR